ncbi:uncharacterized protein [Solanum tuberosum]|uniref:uncharacterized protein n=1 Tax=Solanum tuberosum TaxID=4113 RepID=UPI00073A09F6|nr:PREDICTED: uncharacterized protein LOC107057784 [Solanum tuberosum]
MRLLILAVIGEMRQAPAPVPAPTPAPQCQPAAAAPEVQPPPVHVTALPDLKDREMPLREQKMLRIFQRLAPQIFSGVIGEGTHEIQLICQEQLQSLGLLESRGADFTTHQFRGPARQWWRTYRESRPVGSPSISWSEFSEAFLAQFMPWSVRDMTRGRDSYDRPRQRFQQGQSSRPVQAALPAFEEASISRMVLVRAKVREDQILSLPTAVGLLQAIQLQGVLIAVRLTIGLECAPGKGEGRLYQLPLHLDQFQQCPLQLEVVVRTKIVGTTNRVPEAELEEPATVLFDPESTFSYVSVYFAPRLGMRYESLAELIHVSTLVGESLVVDQVLRSFLVTIQGYDTRVDLILLDMVDFDVILGMDWLSPTMRSWIANAKTGAYSHTPTGIISFMRARRLVASGCLDYLAYVRDMSREGPSVNSVSVVREFADVFPRDLPGLPPERDIDFAIDLEPDTRPISILPFRMAPVELRELSV